MWSILLTYMQRAPRELADSKLRSGQLSPRSRRMERSVYTFFVDRTLSTNYQRQCFEGCPIQARPSVVIGPTVPAQQRSSYFERSTNDFASLVHNVDARVRTDTHAHTHKTTTVTLAAHARRGLKCYIYILTYIDV